MGYPEFLNIRPYMSEPKGDPITYGLYAVLVHSGYSCNAGHYFCYVKVSPGSSLGILSGLGPGKGLVGPFRVQAGGCLAGWLVWSTGHGAQTVLCCRKREGLP